MTKNRNRALSGGAAALIAAGAMSLSVVAPATAAPEDAPILADDSATTADSAITIDVLANDAAPEGATLDASTLALVDESGASVPAIQSELGTWTVADGQLAFAPAEGAEGVAEVTYTVTTSAGATATGTVTVTIEPAPVEPEPTEPAPVEPEPTEPAPVEPEPTEPAPVEPAPEQPEPVEPEPTEPALDVEDDKVAHVFSAESPEATIDVLANDEVEGDVELDPASLALVGDEGEPVPALETEQGTWSVVDGQVVFAAAEGFVGKAVAEYTVATADGETATAEVRVDATWAAPEPDIALADDAVEVPRHEDATVDVLANDVVEGVTLDSETLQLIGEDGQPADEVTTSAGTWSVVDGEVRFDAHPSHRGGASISYVVQTAGGTAGATLTVEVDQHQAKAQR
ncbi:Ig-like domain-containing protein [Agrococcus sp. HG114]|uniref:Ig-like domain-containing protein n=1 Tax=Agrococcus sp. HG114 TaxID=2969757 RepID=UPI00215A36F6|nr:Ig-like domain-containing protein [Agrococcus sp. HG114]MCR8670613.1 Ig-like domain-containing protein [Agrococcus sp. HG114]